MRSQQKAYLNAISAVLAWSTVATAFKLSLRFLSPTQLLFYANASSLICLLLVLLIKRKLGALRALPPRELGYGALLGIQNPFLYYLVLFEAYARLPAQEAQPLNYTWAVTLSLLSVPLLGQRITWREIGGMLISYVGVVVIATRGNPFSWRFENPMGVLLALGSTVIWSLYWIANTRSKTEPAVSLFLSFLFGLPLTGIAAAKTSGLRVDSMPALVGALYVGIFEMGIAFVLWLNALRLSSSTAKVSRLIFFSPFLSMLLIHLVLGETILSSSLLGLALIVGGNALQPSRKNKSKRRGSLKERE